MYKAYKMHAVLLRILVVEVVVRGGVGRQAHLQCIKGMLALAFLPQALTDRRNSELKGTVVDDVRQTCMFARFAPHALDAWLRDLTAG